MGKKKKVLSSKTIKDITNTVPMMLGLGATATFNSWAEIENFAKHHGVYTAPELRKLITEHSPLAKIGDTNLEIARIIDEDIAKKDKSFHAACLNNFRELCVLIAVDPNTVHMGANWMQLQKKKDKRLQQKSFADKMYPKKYAKVIDNLKARYNRVLESNPNAYKEWCIQNKKNRQIISDVRSMIKLLDKKHNQK